MDKWYRQMGSMLSLQTRSHTDVKLQAPSQHELKVKRARASFHSSLLWAACNGAEPCRGSSTGALY